MPTTIAPVRSRWADADWDHPLHNPWTAEAIRQRGGDDYGLGIIELPPEPDEDPYSHTEEVERAVRNADSPQRIAARNLAMLDAMGDQEFEPEPAQDEPAAPTPAVVALDATEPASRAYVVREGDWRERKGLPRKRKSVPPSRTPEGRRASHIAKRAAELGISFAEADRVVQRRQRRTGAPTPRVHNTTHS